MPSQIFHVLAGEKALALSGTVIENFDSAAFRLGCQGPDIFLHNRRTKPLALAYGRLLHRRDYGRFCAEFVSALPPDIPAGVLSWFYGFITHQVADRLLHPYIVYRSYTDGKTGIPGVSSAQFHAFFERILDSELLRKTERKKLDSFDTGSSFWLSGNEIDLLAKAIAPVLSAVYPGEAEKDPQILQRIRNAFTDSIYYYDISNPRLISIHDKMGIMCMRYFVELGAAGVALLHPDEPDPSIDWMNTEKREWRHPVSGEKSSSSVPELFEASVQESARVFKLLRDLLGGNLSFSDFETAIGNECLSVAGPDGKLGKVRFWDAFDLGSALLAEKEKRLAWLGTA
ncbi:zinc dependent phospholipase C family protein [Brucepastera parasyntrophica]|uniref:zinc dependent phospholipase C family protein n=1 Tax=Brucepastera parasyntrophica TaxID=2880008 RepID=UPI00210A1538|nr:zinc dependent phospholipase C family protein [Brucepastera parasyntrophica]ULQ60317.1 zinc dependent phospholipase C family protein [Brucepastera parasyntrophica]